MVTGVGSGGSYRSLIRDIMSEMYLSTWSSRVCICAMN